MPRIARRSPAIESRLIAAGMNGGDVRNWAEKKQDFEVFVGQRIMCRKRRTDYTQASLIPQPTSQASNGRVISLKMREEISKFDQNDT
jgi:hypothetical protein